MARACAPTSALLALGLAAEALGASGVATAAVAAATAWTAAALAGRRGAVAMHRLAPLLEPHERVRARTPGALVAALSDKLAEVKHRTAKVNPTTSLPTREHLLATMTADMADGAPRLLGLLHFADFDQMLVFDDLGAREGLARLGDRILHAVGDRHVVSQVDRATFAVWFGSAGARDEFAALTYVVGQQLALASGPLTPTIGHAVAAYPEDGVVAEQLLARATADLPYGDGARPRARAGAGPDEGRERFVLEQELARAIEQDQLSMAFQPVVDIGAGRLVGAEALLRWDHPTLGAISPTRFIPLVERLGLGERYGLWVLNAACREAARWRAEGFADLRMAVNLSAKQVSDPELEAKIDRTLKRHGLPTSAVELELTETAAMADADRTKALFTRLRARGVGLAIDDFGSGYSSLSYLKNLPFTKLKIDREFVTEIDSRRGSRAICKALLELGRGLDLTVLAEGVETPEEVQVLRGLGCRMFQGFHFSRPLAPDAFLDFARTSPWRSGAAAPPARRRARSSLPA